MEIKLAIFRSLATDVYIGYYKSLVYLRNHGELLVNDVELAVGYYLVVFLLDVREFLHYL